MSVDFEANHLCSNTVGIANENIKYQAMNYQCDNTKSTRDKSLKKAKQELLKEKQNKRKCQHEMEISQLEQLGKKSKK